MHESRFLNRRIKLSNQLMYEADEVIATNISLAHQLSLDDVILSPTVTSPWIEELLDGVLQLNRFALIGAYIRAVS